MSNLETEVNANEQAKNDAMKQFYFILTVVFIILLVFLGFFIYNLIKCYLPKWMNKKNSGVIEETEIRKIEFEEI
jgi:hypothetical protein